MLQSESAVDHVDTPVRALNSYLGGTESRAASTMWCSVPVANPDWNTAEMLECLAHSMPPVSASGDWLHRLKQEPGSLFSLKILTQVTPKISWQKTVGSLPGGIHVWLHYGGWTGPHEALELQHVASSVGILGEEMGPQRSLDQGGKIISRLILQERRNIAMSGEDSTWILEVVHGSLPAVLRDGANRPPGDLILCWSRSLAQLSSQWLAKCQQGQERDSMRQGAKLQNEIS